MRMQALDRWISYADLADLLGEDPSRLVITSDFVLNQLHALIRVPFELLGDYCEDYERRHRDDTLRRRFIWQTGTHMREPSAIQCLIIFGLIFPDTTRANFR
jgi:hypothetical protein